MNKLQLLFLELTQTKKPTSSLASEVAVTVLSQHTEHISTINELAAISPYISPYIVLVHVVMFLCVCVVRMWALPPDRLYA